MNSQTIHTLLPASTCKLPDYSTQSVYLCIPTLEAIKKLLKNNELKVNSIINRLDPFPFWLFQMVLRILSAMKYTNNFNLPGCNPVKQYMALDRQASGARYELRSLHTH